MVNRQTFPLLLIYAYISKPILLGCLQPRNIPFQWHMVTPGVQTILRQIILQKPLVYILLYLWTPESHKWNTSKNTDVMLGDFKTICLMGDFKNNTPHATGKRMCPLLKNCRTEYNLFLHIILVSQTQASHIIIKQKYLSSRYLYARPKIDLEHGVIFDFIVLQICTEISRQHYKNKSRSAA